MDISKIDDRDWSALTLGERIRQVEVEGYVVLPDLLSPDHLTRLKAQADAFETVGRDYSERQRSRGNIQFEGGAITDLIAHPPTIAFLRELFGDEIVFVSYVYDRSEPGTPGISLHTDGQPYGSSIFGYNGSCPFIIRVLYYLDDLTLDVSPFRVVPRSHLCLHADANPYRRYESHPEQVIVPCRAGSALFLNHRTFHGTCPNVGNRARAMLAIAYRPAWAGPIAGVNPWDPADLKKLPPNVRPFFQDPNTRHWDFDVANKPANMPREAPGMNPSRWQRT
jgi:ectoine hydroxylase-related dioxygenase (phytanoyl-CoA dioxygenase family)